MVALCKAIADGGGGVYSANMDFNTYDDVAGHTMEKEKVKAHWKGEWAWLHEVAEASGGKVAMTFEVGSDTAMKGQKRMRQLG